MIRVLIVEDCDSDLRQLVTFLRTKGVNRTHVVADPYFALESLRGALEDPATKPDLLILDLGLGLESGYEVLRFLKSNPEFVTMPVIVWTSVGSKVDEKICEHFGVKSFVKKQQGTLALQLAIEPILESRAS